MENISSPKVKLVCQHIYGIAVFMAIIIAIFSFGDEDNVAVKDDGCVTHGGLKGPGDITPVGPTSALIGSADRENWLLHEIIE